MKPRDKKNCDKSFSLLNLVSLTFLMNKINAITLAQLLIVFNKHYLKDLI